MLKQERHLFIMKQINLHNRVLSADLSILLFVSEDTIRRDLVELAEQDKIIKVHGGALSKSYHVEIPKNNIYAADEKKIIANKTVQLLTDNMFVLLGGGTTVSELVEVLPIDLKITFFTVSLVTALQLCDHPNSEVIFLGGKIAKSSQITSGGEVISRLGEISADLCILGTNGISPENGVTDSDIETVQLKRAMIKAARKTAIVTISEKLSTNQPMRICGLETLDYLITELKPDSDTLLDYHILGLKIL
jgi:DeoR/GlpR family transcriptional regulator of sugar metabolism